jgi:hypothetical protein
MRDKFVICIITIENKILVGVLVVKRYSNFKHITPLLESMLKNIVDYGLLERREERVDKSASVWIKDENRISVRETEMKKEAGGRISISVFVRFVKISSAMSNS